MGACGRPATAPALLALALAALLAELILDAAAAPPGLFGAAGPLDGRLPLPLAPACLESIDLLRGGCWSMPISPGPPAVEVVCCCVAAAPATARCTSRSLAALNGREEECCC